MPKCSYCQTEFEFPRGVIVVDSVTSKVNNYCSRKCREYSKMGRRKSKWSGKVKVKEHSK